MKGIGTFKTRIFIDCVDTVDLWHTDSVTVELPLEEKVYKDSTYMAVVEGYNANLKYIETYNRTERVTDYIVPDFKHHEIFAFAEGMYIDKNTPLLVGAGYQYSTLWGMDAYLKVGWDFTTKSLAGGIGIRWGFSF